MQRVVQIRDERRMHVSKLLLIRSFRRYLCFLVSLSLIFCFLLVSYSVYFVLYACLCVRVSLFVPFDFCFSQQGFALVPLVITIGDYVLTPEICVERKSLSDLFQSMPSGRLYNQARLLS